jgi:hypothetical protein
MDIFIRRENFGQKGMHTDRRKLKVHLAGLRSPALHDLCFAGHAPKACTALYNIYSARLCN